MSAVFPRNAVSTFSDDLLVNKGQLGQTAYLEWTAASGTYNADSEPTAAHKYVIRVTLSSTVLSFLLPNVPLGYSVRVINRSDSLGQVQVRNSASALLVTLPPGSSYRATVVDAATQAWNESSGASTVARSSVVAGSFLLQPRSVNRFTLWSNTSGDYNIRSSTTYSRCEGFSVVSDASGNWSINVSSFGFASGTSYRAIATAVAPAGSFRSATVTSASATTLSGQTWQSTAAVLAAQTLVIAPSVTVYVMVVY